VFSYGRVSVFLHDVNTHIDRKKQELVTIAKNVSSVQADIQHQFQELGLIPFFHLKWQSVYLISYCDLLFDVRAPSKRAR
jgi:hypothetical protein